MAKSGFAAGQLKSLVERIEHLEEEKAALAADVREVYAEAKGQGFDTKIMRQVIRIRKLDKADRAYYEEVIKPLMALPHVEYIGEIGEAEKREFLGNAHALVFPIDWPEPFGLVMIEAMACGTPVIAFNRGSVPEVIENGVSGFVVEDEISAVAALKRLHTLPRAGVRGAFEARFSSKVMRWLSRGNGFTPGGVVSVQVPALPSHSHESLSARLRPVT